MARIFALDEGDAFGQGVVVRALGRPRSCNPYLPQSADNTLWDEGWGLIDHRRIRSSRSDSARTTMSEWLTRPAQSLPQDPIRVEISRALQSFFTLYVAVALALGGFLYLIFAGIARLNQ
jgi:hypothetical protein